jgi:hypothetical protein
MRKTLNLLVYKGTKVTLTSLHPPFLLDHHQSLITAPTTALDIASISTIATMSNHTFDSQSGEHGEIDQRPSVIMAACPNLEPCVFGPSAQLCDTCLQVISRLIQQHNSSPQVDSIQNSSPPRTQTGAEMVILLGFVYIAQLMMFFL